MIRAHSLIQRSVKGMTIIELMIVLAIFSVVMAGLYSAYSVQLKQGVKEYKIAESEMEHQIAKNVIEHDLAMAGYGLADTYCETVVSEGTGTCYTGKKCGVTNLDICMPVPVRAETDATTSTDKLVLMGTALGRENRASQAWSYALDSAPTTTAGFRGWTDAREALKNSDRIIYVEPNVKRFRYISDASQRNSDTDKSWLFKYPSNSAQNPYPTLELYDIVYGIHTAAESNAFFPYYIVKYELGGTAPGNCATGTKNLLRAESKNATPSGGQPLFNCVLDFQVAFGVNEPESSDGKITCWDDGGASYVNSYEINSNYEFRRIKQIKAFILVQDGNKDLSYTYPLDAVTVGDKILNKCGGGTIGRDYTITGDLKRYRWKLITLSIMPRNMR